MLGGFGRVILLEGEEPWVSDQGELCPLDDSPETVMFFAGMSPFGCWLLNVRKVTCAPGVRISPKSRDGI